MPNELALDWRSGGLVTGNNAHVEYFHFKFSNVIKVANFYGIVLFPRVCCFLRCTLSLYSRTPRIRPPSESYWCGRIRGMVAREGFVYEQKPLSVTGNVVV